MNRTRDYPAPGWAQACALPRRGGALPPGKSATTKLGHLTWRPHKVHTGVPARLVFGLGLMHSSPWARARVACDPPVEARRNQVGPGSPVPGNQVGPGCQGGRQSRGYSAASEFRLLCRVLTNAPPSFHPPWFHWVRSRPRPWRPGPGPGPGPGHGHARISTIVPVDG